jgi:hypothetical protein
MLNFSAPSFRILVAILTLVFFIILMLIRINRTLDEFKRVTGEVIESGTTTIYNSKGQASKAFRIKLNTLDLNFGIKEYTDLYNYFLVNDPTGKELTIYYAPEGKYVADNLTLHVGQIEMGQQTLLTFEDTKTLYYFGAFVFILLFIICLPIYIWVLRIEKRKSKK